MTKQLQVFLRSLLISILALGTSAQFTTTAQTITMTTAKKVGDKINLYIIAHSDIAIDGATGTFENGKRVGFTLTKQTIAITGSVKVFHCDMNQITTLDVSKNAALTELACFSNQLTSLDLSKNTALTKLFCERNQLANLDLSKNTALVDVYCSANQIKGEAMTTLVKSLRSLPTNRKGEICIIDTKYAQEGNVCTKAKVKIANDKGWRVTDFNGRWNDRKDYAGSEEEAQENVITMTTAKKVGDKIALLIKAEGDVSIDGATGTFVNGWNVEYTLTKQTVTITGRGTELYCDRNQLTSLDLSQNRALIQLDCSENQLTSLDVSKNTLLTYLACATNQLTTLDVSKNTLLTYLTCTSNKLVTLDVSKNAALTELHCINNQLVTLDVSQNAALTGLRCYSNQLTTLDVSKNVALTGLRCYSNQLTTLDVSQNVALTDLNCSANQLKSLDVSKNPALIKLWCYSNQIKDEAMTSLVKSLLTNRKGEIDVINTKDAKEQNVCTKSQVAIAKKKGWKVYDFNGSHADRKDYAGSEEEEVQENVITMTTAKKVGDKITLIIQAEGEVSIDGVTGSFVNEKKVEYALTKQTITIKGKVTLLDCWLNKITHLDVSKNIALADLRCGANQLKSLDVSKNTALTYLGCYSNQLTTLDLSKNAALILLSCHSNQIKGEAMTSLVTSLPASENSEICIIDTKNVKEGNVCAKAEVAIAKGKGWRVLDFNDSWNDRKDYEGSEGEETAGEEIITMTTDKEIGEKIKLRIITEGDASIDGVTGTFVNGRSIDYILTKQTVIIKGKVTLLNCYGNQLTSLDVSTSTPLTRLICYNNRLKKLEVSKNTALIELNCSANKLTSLDVLQNTALIRLICYSNQLTKLDVSKIGALKEFWCDNNQLTSLDLSQNTVLTEFGCHSNQIKGEAMTNLVNSLPTCDKGEIYIINTKDAKEQNACTKADVAIAKGKGWKVYDFNGTYEDHKDYAGSDGNSVAAINSGSVQIYPNPARDFVQVKAAKDTAIVHLYSLDGHLVLTSKTDADGTVRLDVSALATGEYLLTVGSSYNQRISIVR